MYGENGGVCFAVRRFPLDVIDCSGLSPTNWSPSLRFRFSELRPLPALSPRDSDLPLFFLELTGRLPFFSHAQDRTLLLARTLLLPLCMCSSSILQLFILLSSGEPVSRHSTRITGASTSLTWCVPCTRSFYELFSLLSSNDRSVITSWASAVLSLMCFSHSFL